jgi:hypothetical protein
MVEENRWQRPICVLVTTNQQVYSWLKPCLRLEGMYLQAIPIVDPKIDTELMRWNLIELSNYAGFADPDVPLNPMARNFGSQLFPSLFMQLALAQRNAHDFDGCRETSDRLKELFPPERLELPAQLKIAVEQVCEPASTDQAGSE